MSRGEMMDLIIDYGGPIEAAEATERNEEIIECLEKEIERDQKYLEEAKECEDQISIIIYVDGIARTREVIERLRSL